MDEEQKIDVLTELRKDDTAEAYEENKKRIDKYIERINNRNPKTVLTKEFVEIKKVITREFNKNAKPLKQINTSKKGDRTVKIAGDIKVKTNKHLLRNALDLMDNVYGGMIFEYKWETYAKRNKDHPNLSVLKKALEEHLDKIEKLEEPFMKLFKEGLGELKYTDKLENIAYLVGSPFLRVKAINMLKERPKKECEFYEKHYLIPLRFEVYPSTEKEEVYWKRKKAFRDHPIRNSPIWFEAVVKGKHIFFYEMQRNKLVRGFTQNYTQLKGILENMDLFADTRKIRALLIKMRKKVDTGFLEALFKKYLEENRLEDYFRRVRMGKHDKITAAYAEEFVTLILELQWASKRYGKYGLNKTKIDFFDDIVDVCYRIRGKINRQGDETSLAFCFPLLIAKDCPFSIIMFRIMEREKRRSNKKFVFPKDQKDYDELTMFSGENSKEEIIAVFEYKTYLSLRGPLWWVVDTRKAGEVQVPKGIKLNFDNTTFWYPKGIPEKEQILIANVKGQDLPQPAGFVNSIITAINKRTDKKINEKWLSDFFEKFFNLMIRMVGTELNNRANAPAMFSANAWVRIKTNVIMILSNPEMVKQQGGLSFEQAMCILTNLMFIPVILSNYEWAQKNTNLKKNAKTWLETLNNAFDEQKDEELVKFIRKNTPLAENIVEYTKKGFRTNKKEYNAYFKNLAEEFESFILPFVGEKIKQEEIKKAVEGMTKSLHLLKEEQQSAS